MQYRSLIILFIILVLGACQQPQNNSSLTSENTDSALVDQKNTDHTEVLNNTDFTRKPAEESYHQEEEESNRSAENKLVDIPEVYPQFFIINSTRDTIITGKEGTKIFIPARSLVNKDGKVILGEVRMRLSEFYSLDDMLKKGLTTRSGKQILETGGMFELSATKDNQELSIRKGSEIGIEFATGNDDAFDYYKAQRIGEHINWQVDTNAKKEIPVLVCVGGRNHLDWQNFFIENYRLDKTLLLALQKEEWNVQASLNEKGEIVGYKIPTVNERENKHKLKKKVRDEFIALLKKPGFRFPPTEKVSWETSWTFKVFSREEYNSWLALQEAKKAVSLRKENLKRITLARGLWFITAFGLGNKDRPIPPLPLADFKVPVASVSNGSKLKLVLNHNKSVINGIVEDEFVVFKSIPKKFDAVLIDIKPGYPIAQIGTAKVNISNKVFQGDLNYQDYSEETTVEAIAKAAL